MKRKTANLKEYHRIYDRQPKIAFYRYLKRATKLKYSFSLSFEEFEVLTKEPCFYCGELPSDYHTIDRKDSDIGYEKSNSVSCCTMCNYMKRTYSVRDFLNKCNQIVTYRERMRLPD